MNFPVITNLLFMLMVWLTGIQLAVCISFTGHISSAEPSDPCSVVIALCSALPAHLFKTQFLLNGMYCSELFTV